MKIIELVELITTTLEKDGSAEKRIKRTNKLLLKLDKKEDKIRRQCKMAKTVTAQKRLKTKIKIIELQRKNCQKYLSNLTVADSESQGKK